MKRPLTMPEEAQFRNITRADLVLTVNTGCMNRYKFDAAESPHESERRMGLLTAHRIERAQHTYH
jgi:hypothetical protein